MFSLPNQTLDDWQETLEKVTALDIQHISAYSLIIEEGTPFYDMELSLPDEDTERRMYHRTNTLLQKSGYSRYEISNFAKKGYECRHNLTYWTGIDYVGFGIGAASYFQGYRYKNISDISRYIEMCSCSFMPQEAPWHEERQLLTVEEKMEEFMFLGLRLKAGISEETFYETFQRNVDDVYPDVLKRLTEEGVLVRKNHWIYLSKKGTDVANYAMAQFLLN